MEVHHVNVPQRFEGDSSTYPHRNAGPGRLVAWGRSASLETGRPTRLEVALPPNRARAATATEVR